MTISSVPIMLDLDKLILWSLFVVHRNEISKLIKFGEVGHFCLFTQLVPGLFFVVTVQIKFGKNAGIYPPVNHKSIIHFFVWLLLTAGYCILQGCKMWSLFF